MSADALAAEAEVLRFVAPRPEFVGEDGGAPTARALEPSTAEKARPPVRVSVWDLAKTTPAQAKAFVPRTDYELFTLRVSDVLDIGQLSGANAMRVLYDPLDPPESSRAGADGHAGIEGLEHGAKHGETRSEWRARLHRLARRLRRFDPQ